MTISIKTSGLYINGHVTWLCHVTFVPMV